MTERTLLVALLVGVLLHPSIAFTAPPPAEAFIRPPAYHSVQLSPDGRYVSALARLPSSPEAVNLVLVDLQEGGQPQQLTSYSDAVIHSYGWTGDYLVFALVDGAGEVRNGVFAIRRDGREGRELRRGAYGSPDIVQTRGAPEGHVYVAFDPARRGQGVRGLHRVDLEARQWTRVAALSGASDWSVAPRVERFAALSIGGTRGAWTVSVLHGDFRDKEPGHCLSEPWLELATFGIATDGAGVWVAARAGEDRAALYLMDADTCALGQPVVTDPDYDVGLHDTRPVRDYAGRTVGIRYAADYPRLVWFDDEWAAMASMIDGALPDTFNEVVSSDRDGRLFVVRASSPDNPGIYYLYDRKKQRLEYLVAEYPDLEGHDLGRTDAILFEASDGWSIPGYLTLPAGADSGDHSRLLPMVLLVHGGPFGLRDIWAFDPWGQFLASRGFAVLRINFRGSGGLGRRHEEAGYRQWGLRMQEDLHDAVRWAVSEDLADPERVCIMGGSYGGYAAMTGIATTNLFRCGISVNGIMDLSGIRERRFVSRRMGWGFVEMVGDPMKDRERLRRTSPLHLVEDMKAPVLLAHSVDDEVVNPHYTRVMGKALRGADRPAILLDLEGSDHDSLREDQHILLLEAVEAFLGEHLAAIPSPPEQARKAAE